VYLRESFGGLAAFLSGWIVCRRFHWRDCGGRRRPRGAFGHFVASAGDAGRSPSGHRSAGLTLSSVRALVAIAVIVALDSGAWRWSGPRGAERADDP
jgi:hypothetical protein